MQTEAEAKVTWNAAQVSGVRYIMVKVPTGSCHVSEG